MLASGNPPGWARFLDPTFGSAGTVSLDSRSGSIAVQPDGKVVVTGLAGDVSNYAFALARYSADGSPDLAFGPDGNGRVVTDVTPVSDHPVAVAIAPGGQILVAGTNGDFGTSSTAGDFLLVRYTPDGILDSAFGNGGVVITDVARRQDIVSAMLVQPDGKVVLAGYDTIGFQGLAASARRVALARYAADGSLDRSFGSDGIVLTDFPSSPSEWLTSAALQPDGGIVVRAGIATSFASNDSVLLRYTGAGAMDDTFGGGQPVRADGFNVAVAPGGRILVLGGAASPFGDNDFAVFGFNPDGSVDRDFGNGGRTLTNFGTSNQPGRRRTSPTTGPLSSPSHRTARSSSPGPARRRSRANPPRPRSRSPATTPTGNSIADSANVAGSSPSSAPTSRTSSGWRSTAPATSWWPYPPAPPTRSRLRRARQSEGAGKSRNAARHGERGRCASGGRAALTKSPSRRKAPVS